MDDKPQDQKIPLVWKLTPLSRAMVNFNSLLESPASVPFFRSVETVEGCLNENKRLGRKSQFLYLFSFLGACVVLLGPLPPELRIHVGELEAPLSALPQQLVSILTAVLYSQFIYLFSSMLMLQQMVERILTKYGPEAWQFFAARFDATMLWGAALAPKFIGYQSPRRHRWMALLLVALMFSTLVAHAVIVCAATLIAARSAFEEGSVLLEVLGTASAVIAIMSVFWFGTFLAVKMPFRLDPAHRPPT